MRRAIGIGVGVMLVVLSTACGGPQAEQPRAEGPPPDVIETITPGCSSRCGSEAPTTPLAPDEYFAVPGVAPVTDIGFVTRVEYDADVPVLLWDRAAYHRCSLDEKRMAELQHTTACLSDYSVRNDNTLLRRYRVAPTAKIVLLADVNGSTSAAPAGIERLAEVEGSPSPFVVSVDRDANVIGLGQVYLP